MAKFSPFELRFGYNGNGRFVGLKLSVNAFVMNAGTTKPIVLTMSGGSKPVNITAVDVVPGFVTIDTPLVFPIALVKGTPVTVALTATPLTANIGTGYVVITVSGTQNGKPFKQNVKIKYIVKDPAGSYVINRALNIINGTNLIVN